MLYKSNEQRLATLNLHRLEARHMRIDVITAYKIIFGITNADCSMFFFDLIIAQLQLEDININCCCRYVIVMSANLVLRLVLYAFGTVFLHFQQTLVHCLTLKCLLVILTSIHYVFVNINCNFIVF